MTPGDLVAFERSCVAISDEAADHNGFVALQALLQRFNAKLLVRPLLVEGMLAINRRASSSASNDWAVLVDSETYPVTEDDVQCETGSQPLPSRLRFTVAHELAHSLAFRPAEFGIKLRNRVDDQAVRKVLVQTIERHTDRLSPLLLVSEKALQRVFGGLKPPSVSEIADARGMLGVSRDAFVSRLKLLSHDDANSLRSRGGLKNMGLAICEWTDPKHAVLRSWPAFVNFDRNVIPTFLIRLAREDRLPFSAVAPDDLLSRLHEEPTGVEVELDAGVFGTPKAEKMLAVISIERAAQVRGSRFMLLVRRAVSDSVYQAPPDYSATGMHPISASTAKAALGHPPFGSEPTR